MSTRLRAIIVLVAAAALLAPARAAASTVTVGGLPTSRDPYSPVAAGAGLRTALADTANFGTAGSTDPNLSFAYTTVGGASSFTSSDLAGVDVFALSFTDSGTALTLSTAEAAALEDFVRSGHDLVIFTEYNHPGSAALVAGRFGVTYGDLDTGITDWDVLGGATAITTGPFGTIAGPVEFSRNNAGAISGLGSATGVTRLSGSSTTYGFAFFAIGAFAPGAGGVLFVNDDVGDFFYTYPVTSFTQGPSGSIGVNAAAQNLLFNAFDYLGANAPVPEPGALALAALGLAVLARRARRH